MNLRIGSFLCSVAGLIWAGAVWGQAPSDFVITSIVVSKNCVETQNFETLLQALENPDCPKSGEIQLIQVSVENNSPTPRRVTIVLEIKRDGAQVKQHSETRTLPSSGRYRMLYSYPIPEVGGRYDLSAQIIDAQSKKILAISRPGVERDFYILKQSEIEDAVILEEEKLIEEAKRTPQPLEFEPADLRWEGVYVIPKHVLRGEKFLVRMDLINVGGDIARPVQAQLDYYNVRLPRRRTAIATPTTESLAPGETATFELEYTFPDDQLLGEYQLLAIADPRNLIQESDAENNQLTSEVIRLSDIKILIPPEGFEFEETGLFLFQWDSVLFREFKLQIGIDEKFKDPANYFDLPQGDRWVADKELVPLPGELPVLAQGLMKTHRKSIAFWRVIGRRSDGSQAFSDVRTFSIKADEEESQ